MVGTPLPGVSLRIVGEQGATRLPGEVGEVQIRGENVFTGYWGRAEENSSSFTADGYFRTGDLGRWEPNGYLSIAGRHKDLVITGGLNVYPKEVEMAIDQLDGVAESAVIGVPHPDFGEAVVAVVIPKPGFPQLTEASLLRQLKEMLANYKVPKRVFFTADFPRNALGKVQKNRLRDHPEYAEPFRQP
jgi:malonyl-CoA/methylmalonyl-CoA synthetase